MGKPIKKTRKLKMSDCFVEKATLLLLFEKASKDLKANSIRHSHKLF